MCTVSTCQDPETQKAQPNPNAWMDSLTLILLGIRTALKQDISTTAAEMVYGTTLRLPGEFFNSSPTTSLSDPKDFVTKLRAHFRTIQPTSPRLTRKPATIADSLSTASHVFVRHDAVRKPLQPPYDGPFKVIKRTNKHFTVALNGRNDTVSIDRLKPAHLDSEHSDTNTEHSLPTPAIPTSPSPASPTHIPTSTTPPHTTRSGRRVHFPTYLSRNV